VTTKNIFDIIHGAATVKSADPEKNVIIGVTQSSGMTVDWVLEKLYRKELDQGNETAAFDCIEKEIHAIPPGSGKLLITPWLYGEYCPVYSEHVRMTMFNLTNIHTRAHIMKAVYEGIGYNLRWIRENYEKDFGVKLSGLRVIGGGAVSEHWMQIIADIMQVKVQVLEEKRFAGALGAAVCALIGLGVYEGFHKLNDVVKVKKEFLPIKENREIYDNLFDAYKGLYSALKESYERI
jgi:xylulokinase